MTDCFRSLVRYVFGWNEANRLGWGPDEELAIVFDQEDMPDAFPVLLRRFQCN